MVFKKQLIVTAIVPIVVVIAVNIYQACCNHCSKHLYLPITLICYPILYLLILSAF